MGVTKDYSVRYTVWTLFIYMSWVAIGCMIYEQKHWLEWAVVRPESGGKNCHRLCREFFRKTEQHEGQWMLKGKMLKKKKMGKIWVLLAFVSQITITQLKDFYKYWMTPGNQNQKILCKTSARWIISRFIPGKLKEASFNWPFHAI